MITTIVKVLFTTFVLLCAVAMEIQWTGVLLGFLMGAMVMIWLVEWSSAEK